MNWTMKTAIGLVIDLATYMMLGGLFALLLVE